MDLWKSFAIIVVFTFVSAFFVAAETALVALRESQAQRLADRGKRGSRLLNLVAQPNRWLAAVQVGITVATFLSAAYGAAEIAPSLVPWLTSLGLSESTAGTVAFLAITLLIAYFTLVVGELVPKRLALRNVDGMSLAVAAPIDLISTLFRPIIWLLSASTNAVMRVMGIRDSRARENISGEELRGIVAAHEELTAEERELISDVFDAGDRELREVMVPRTEVDFLDGGLPVQRALEIVLELPHTRYPVIRGSADQVIGFVHLRDIIASSVARPAPLPLSMLVREIPAFPGTKRLIPALTEMRREGHHLALVLDEYGGTAGIVTMEDLVEELVGDIRDEYDLERAHSGVVGGMFEIDGLLNLEDFEEAVGLTLPEGPYETVAGFMVARSGMLPSVGATVDFGGRRLSVLELDGRRISRVRVEPIDAVDPDPDAPDTAALPQ